MSPEKVGASDPDGDPARPELERRSKNLRASLRILIKQAEASQYKLVHWERLGQPPITEKIHAVFEGPMEDAGKVVQEMLRMPRTRPRIRDIFPKGIPTLDRVTFELDVLPDLTSEER
jgi:hypothetical protein